MMPGRTVGRSESPDEDSDALEWEPSSSVDGRGYTVDDHADELARHLPDRWEVSKFEVLSPKEKNHGGGPILRLRLDHQEADANIRMTPHSTLSDRSPGPRVLNSQIVTRQVNGETTTVAEAVDMVIPLLGVSRRDRTERLLPAVVSSDRRTRQQGGAAGLAGRSAWFLFL